MSKIHDEIAMCAQLEQHRYILSEILKEKQQIYTALANKNPKPHPPQPPSNVDTLPYPKYNEQKYYTKNKVSGFAEWLRANAAALGFVSLACCGNPLTLILAPFVAILALLLFLLFLVVTPISKRRTARKAYIKECENIDLFNQKARLTVEQYQKDYAEYERKLLQYEARQQNVDIQNRLWGKSIETAIHTHSTISTILNNYYGKIGLHKSYNNYIAITTVNSYIQSGQCSTLENAIEKFNTDKQNGKISPSIEFALANKSVTQSSMSAVIDSLNNAQSACARLRKDTIEYFANILEHEEYASQPSPIDSYCSSILNQFHSF